MKLTFLGTRGNIEPKNQRHRMHTSLLVSYEGKEVMVDAGEDWQGKLDEVNPRAIVITHAHPDHAFALKDGAPCPVYATDISWEDMENFDIEEEKRHVIKPRQPAEIQGITFEAFTLEHSTIAPAVGYRISAGEATIFYMPDGAYIHNREEALKGVDVYIGDGATIKRSMVRKMDDALIGHAPIQTQLTWCKKEGVPKAIITHCGSLIVKGDERKLGPELDRIAEERGVEVEIAHDGMVRYL